MNVESKTVFIALGSNLGDRRLNISKAIGLLRLSTFITVDKISSIIETDPAGGPKQDKYLNAVVEIRTTLSPRKLLVFLQDIEKKLGRIKGVVNGPRLIDLDILLYSDRIVKEKGLIIPHPRMWERYFVLNPLLEISPHILEGHPLVRPFKQKILAVIHSY